MVQVTPESTLEPKPVIQHIPPPRSRKRYARLMLAVVGLAACAAVLFLYLQASADARDTQDALDTARDELTAAQSRLAAGEERARGLQEELAGRADQLVAVQAELDGVGATLADTEAQLGEARQGVVDFLAASFALGMPVSETQGACMAESMLAEQGVSGVLGGLAAVATGDVNLLLAGDMLAAAAECGVDPDGFGIGSAFAYGDDAGLDALYDACASGSGEACDELYFVSPIGSDYELFGFTCGAVFSIEESPDSCVGSL